MKLDLLDPFELVEVDPVEDPLHCYRMPFMNWLYFKRLKMGVRLLQGQMYDSLLDVGYGSGILLLELAKRCRKLYGIDKHGKSREVKEILARHRLEAELLDADVLRMPFPDRMFDCVTCISVLDHIPDLAAALREIHRVLRPGGTVIVGLVIKNWITDSVFHLLKSGTDKHHVHTYQGIFNILKSGLNLEKTLHFPSFFPEKIGAYVSWRFKKATDG